MAPFGFQDRVHEINHAAAVLARKVAGDRALVAGAMGPLGVRMEPFGPTAREEVRAHFREQAEGLLKQEPARKKLSTKRMCPSRQTSQGYILVVDDCSDDRPEDVVARYEDFIRRGMELAERVNLWQTTEAGPEAQREP